jgi:cleaved adhesin domain-containing protein
MKKLLFLILALIFSNLAIAQLNESFEGEWLPFDWSIIDNDGGYTITESFLHISAHTGTHGARASVCQDDYLITPKLSPTVGDNTFGYWVRCEYSSNAFSFEIMVSNTGTAIEDFVQIADYPNFNIATWTNQTESLSAYNGQEIYVAIHIYSTPYYALDFGFDDITGPAVFVPSCQHTSAQTETNISTVSADLGWTENATATAWQIEWGPTGFTQGSGTMVSTTSNPYHLTGLADTTTYDWYVRADCGGGDFSTWETSTFTTALAAPFNEPFTNTSIPDGWSKYGPNYWYFSTDATNGAAAAGDHTPGGGTQYAWADVNNGGTANGFTLETPLIDLGNLTAPEFSFWYFSNNTNTPGDNNMLYCEMSIDGGSWVNIFTYSGNCPSWDIFTHDLSSYTISGSVKFRFIVDMNISHAYYNYILIDDVVVGEAPLCPDPSAQTTKNIIGNSANLVWSENGTATSWQIEWGPNGFSQGNGTVETVASNPYNLAGLSATTSYDWYVRADCGGGNYGTWVGPCTFTTPCVSVTAFPWIEDFDAIAGTPDCWTNNSIPNYTQIWEILDFLASFGAYHDHTTNSGNFARVDDSPDYSRPTNLDTPPLDVTALTTPILSFWYWIGRGASGSMLYIDVFDGTSWTEGIDTLLPHNGWIKDTVNITAYSSVATQIRFRGMENMNGSSCDICIDDVSVDEIASCAAPTALTSANITLNVASLSWTENGTANTWDIEYGPTDFSRGSGTVVTGITTNPYTLTGLSSSTTYDWYVRADCGSGDFSLWEMPDIFTTTCNMVSLPIIQGFNSPYIKDCWTETIVVNTSWWTPELNYVTYGSPWCEPYEGGYMVEFNSTYTADGNEIRLESPEFSTSGMTAARVMFAWHEYFDDPDPDEGVTVQWSLDGSVWNNGTFYPRTVGSAYGWSNKIYNLPAGALGQSSVYIGFLFHSSSGYNCFLDDVTIEETPSCLYPSAQTTTYVTSTSAKLGWTENGSATTWEIEWGQTGFTQGNGNMITGITDNPYYLNGLAEDNTYDWYVRADCGGGDYSMWIGPQTFTSTCVANTLYPWEEDFEGEYIPGCWSKIVSAGNDITQSTTQNHTTSGSSSARFSSSSTSSDYNQYLFTGQHLIDYDYGQLTFWHRKENTDTELLEWGIATTTDPNDFTWTAVPLSDTEWQETSVYIGNYCYQTVYIGFHYYGNNSEHVYLDDISIDAVATCLAPSFQEETDITANSATLNWTANGTAGIWEIEFGATGFIPRNGTVVSTSDNPYQLTGIPAITTYDWYIRSDCGGDLYSYRVGPSTFTTPCPPISIPRYEDFDSSDELPFCWLENGDVWEVAVIDGKSGYSVLADDNNNGIGFLYSPQFDGTSKSDLHVRFFTHWEAWYPSQWQEGYFYGSPDGGTTQILLEDWYHMNPSSDEGWKQYDISSWADGASNIVFWWKISMNMDRFWLIDDFGIQEGSFVTDVIWTGATDNDWHTGSNWDDGLVPDTYSNVEINLGLTNYPTINDNANCNNLTVENGVNLTIESDNTGTGSLIVNGTATGNVTMERYIESADWTDWEDGWHFVSSPVPNYPIENNFTVTPADEYDFYTWSEPDNLWVNFKNITEVPTFLSVNGNSNNFKLGTGYMAAYKNADTKSFVGEINVGDVEVADLMSDRWNLLGNPFTSALTWDSGDDWQKVGINGTAQIWNEDGKSYSAISSGDVIPATNGFMVQVGSAEGSLTIPSSKRVHSSQAFYKNSGFPVIKLKAHNLDSPSFQESLVIFNPESTTAYEMEFDGDFLPGYAAQFYSKIGDLPMAVSSMPECSESLKIPFVFVKNEGANFSIEMYEEEGMSMDVWLLDRKSGNKQNLSQNPTYVFTAYEGDESDRFEIQFGVVGIEDNKIENNIQLWAANKCIHILNPDREKGTIRVINMFGQTLAESELNGNDSQKFNIDFPSGNYVVSIVGRQQTISKKVFVK